MVIKMMGHHGFHEPMLQDRLKDETLVAAKLAPVLWLPSDEQINRLEPRKWAALRTSLRNELKTIELAKQVPWQDLAPDVDREIVFRVRAIQAEREARRIRLKYEELLGNGEHNLLQTYEQERVALHAEIQRLNDAKDEADLGAAELAERVRNLEKRSVALPQVPAVAGEVNLLEKDTLLMERLADSVLMSVGQMRNDYQSILVDRMDSEITFLRSVIERLMAK